MNKDDGRKIGALLTIGRQDAEGETTDHDPPVARSLPLRRHTQPAACSFITPP